MRQILLNVRQNEQVRETIGESIRPEPTWYLNGDPWISGSVNLAHYAYIYIVLIELC